MNTPTKQHYVSRKSREILEHAQPNLVLIGLLCVIGYPLYYIMWAYIYPQPYESLWVRLSIGTLGVPWIVYDYLPSKIKRYFPYYFLLTAFIMMPFFFNFMMLKNEWSMVWAMSTMAALFLLIILIYDWIMITLMTIFGFLLAYLGVYLIDGSVKFTYFQFEYIPVFLFALVGGMICNHNRQMATETKLSLLKSLSGSIAHEMRNPLGSITNAMGSLQTLLPQKPEPAQQQREYSLSRSGLISLHNVIEENSETILRANKIIDSILANMQGKALDISSFRKLSARESIQNAVNSYSYKAPAERGVISVNLKDDFPFVGDKDLFVYVIFNLLKNALYYIKPDGFRIEISTETTPQENLIRVFDTGPGINPRKLEKIFDSFYTTGKKGGIGLGLAFCRRVIESFGGSISCQSREHEWTEFIISLPTYSSQKTQRLKQQILSRKHVLVVDDSNANRLQAKHLLAAHRCRISEAENGQEAIALISAEHFDLILMDMEMPILSGDEASRQIKSGKNIAKDYETHNSDVPIIALTSLSKEEALPRVQRAGMDGLISKPLTPEKLYTVLEDHIFSEKDQTNYTTGSPVLENPTILLVDDNLTSRKFMNIILERMGARVVQAENGLEALKTLDSREIHLVFMDMEMPVMDGVEATRQIRSGKTFKEFKNYRTIPIIALTGNTDREHIDRILESGMNAHLGKPVSRNELNAVFSKWLSGFIRQASPAPPKPLKQASMQDILKDVRNEATINQETVAVLRDTGGDELLTQLIEIYLDDTRKIIDNMVTASAQNDHQAINQLSHTLKGSSGSVGAQKMHVLATHLNRIAKNEAPADYRDWIHALQDIFEATIKEFSALRTSP
ncbi:response regulator [Prosthecochloris sp. DSM 1685]|uniref:hybrid sensor histidine kinase/response regulator n=1 Tax=Prosthecochloris ethylica TaxID=2743976 RepID=UPI001883EC50|nr:hybrid sensor histidine kinase/response regulator [Prosthecochloris ethylica]NUK48117.1 response regulator [Prosthecochloris ethylica]